MPLQKCNCHSSSQSIKFNESFEFSIVFIGLEERLFFLHQPFLKIEGASF